MQKTKKPARRIVVLREKTLENVEGGGTVPTPTKEPLDTAPGYRPQGPGRDWGWW